MSARDDLELELKALVISSLALEAMLPDQIDSRAPLFGDGLGLDSIDALELVIALQRKYGFKASETPEFNRECLASIDALANFVEPRLARA